MGLGMPKAYKTLPFHIPVIFSQNAITVLEDRTQAVCSLLS